MSELIDRQEVIDRFNVIRPVDPKKDEYTKGIDVGIAMCIVAVKYQPTIQHVATDTNVGNNSEIPNSSDAISRQAVIDAVEKNACNTQRIMDAVNNLPSVQPERAEGEWSDGYRWQRCYLCKQTGKKSWNYCPNCGAKMKGVTK